MTTQTVDLAREVPDTDLEYVERLLFYEFNEALEKKQKGLDVNDEIMRLEKAMESISTVRQSLDDERKSRVQATADSVDDVLDDFSAN